MTNGLMTKKANYIVSLVLMTLSFQFATAQSVSVKASIDSSYILIGQPIQLVLEATVPLGVNVDWFPLDSLPHFEFIDKGKIDTVTTQDGKAFRQLITITSFDSGRWSIPQLPLRVDDRETLTDSISVNVDYSAFDPKQDYHDIKDIIVVDNPYLKYINWFIAGIALIALVLTIYFLRKKVRKYKPSPNTFSDSKLSPLQEALEALQQLQKQPLQSGPDVKNYYTVLNDIVRQFWWRKTSWAARKKTNDELVQQLSRTDLPQNEKLDFAQQLRMTDAVKFAKYIPSFEENSVAFETTKKSLQSLDGILKNN
ncbi:BatD family protein [Pinibacter aurantiacus]|uniref:BatD family protein n=1 Tax=Pinibacter aurantiacus TaxID=2851599 RepID=A0A9E2SB11_9BACT|nr:BatD family protein [Pinibacter aurantiacus]MBV4356575.1 BatD family protein [Pinibacter aurantiacus]